MQLDNLVIEDATLVLPFRNFRGREQKYTREGDRHFTIELSPEQAKHLEELGWNIRYLTSRDEDGEDLPILQVHLKYNYKAPRVVLITHNSRTELDEETVGELDFLDFSVVDLVIRPYEYDFNGSTGVKAMLKTMFVTVDEDELERKYS